MQFPQEIRTQIAAYMADDLQAVDPQCYRACRTVQAAYRGWRSRRWPCAACGHGTAVHAGYCAECYIIGYGHRYDMSDPWLLYQNMVDHVYDQRT